MKGDRDLWARFVSGVLFPFQERMKGHSSVARLRELEQSQWWSRARLEEARIFRLKTLLTQAYLHVPFYRRMFDKSGFRPEALTSIRNLAGLPLLAKQAIRANLDDMKADDARVLMHYNTGGSSGEPLVFYIGNDRISHDVAAKWRALRWWNVDIGDREVVVWGSPIELGAQDRLRVVRDWLLRSSLLPAFEMSEEKLDRFIVAIRAIRPRMLFGYPSALALIASRAEASGQGLNDLGVEVAFVTAERLYDHQREQIASAFGCTVANGYGGRDAGFVAHECPHGGMHIMAEDVVVEIVGPSGEALGPGEEGEIVVTHLASGEFPFIRYRTGDIGVLDERACACGRGLPLLREIQGRSTDFVVAEDGTIMHGLALIYILRDLPEIAAFKIIQETRQRLLVQLVPTSAFSPGVEARIRGDFKARLGQGVEVIIQQVKAIPPEQSGKFRYVVSRVQQSTAAGTPAKIIV